MNNNSMTAMAEQYVAYRRSLGFKLQTEGRQTMAFATYADSIGHQGPLTTELALQWARLPEEKTPLYWARRLEVVRCFARYLAVFEPATEIPPKKLMGTAHRRSEPYIYSEEEIGKLIGASKTLAPRDGLRPQTYAVLFGLLACSGLRISEALHLRQDDMDLEQGVLEIKSSKLRKSRYVPLHSTAVGVLERYVKCRQRHHPAPDVPAFFLAERGAPLCYSTVRCTFQELRKQLGWRPSASGRVPRIHDLRHTFACRRLLQWYEEGVDVHYAIASLSTYLGHAKVSDTYWYLTATPDLLAVGAERFEHYARNGRGELL